MAVYDCRRTLASLEGFSLGSHGGVNRFGLGIGAGVGFPGLEVRLTALNVRVSWRESVETKVKLSSQALDETGLTWHAWCPLFHCSEGAIRGGSRWRGDLKGRAGRISVEPRVSTVEGSVDGSCGVEAGYVAWRTRMMNEFWRLEEDGFNDGLLNILMEFDGGTGREVVESATGVERREGDAIVVVNKVVVDLYYQVKVPDDFEIGVYGWGGEDVYRMHYLISNSVERVGGRGNEVGRHDCGF